MGNLEITPEAAGALQVVQLIGGNDKLQAWAQGYLVGMTGADDFDAVIEAVGPSGAMADKHAGARLRGLGDFLSRAKRSKLTRAVGTAASVVTELHAILGRQQATLSNAPKPKPVTAPPTPKPHTAAPKTPADKVIIEHTRVGSGASTKFEIDADKIPKALLDKAEAVKKQRGKFVEEGI